MVGYILIYHLHTVEWPLLLGVFSLVLFQGLGEHVWAVPKPLRQYSPGILLHLA